MILLTGGAGFIGGNLVHHWCARPGAEPVVVLDKLTYAGNPATIEPLIRRGAVTLVQGDIADRALVDRLLATHRPRAILHLAAESHVDRSIDAPDTFIRTNVNGTFTLLEAARAWWAGLDAPARTAFRFLHVSTDEVYGSLEPADPPFDETTPYAPNSPYAASKAASDHLVRAFHRTWGLPTLTTHCSNNYGPWQFPEKFIPVLITQALEGKPLPLYGDGAQVRDWIHVRDHCEALVQVLAHGQPGRVYDVGGLNEVRNLDVAHQVCAALDELRPRADGHPYRAQISFVTDRLGHDRRYAIQGRRIAVELGFKPAVDFATGLRQTVQWYLDNPAWTDAVRRGEHLTWMARHLGAHGLPA